MPAHPDWIAILDSTCDGVVVHDLATRETEWSDGVLRLLELPPGERPTLDRIRQQIGPDDLARLEHAINGLLDPHFGESRTDSAGADGDASGVMEASGALRTASGDRTDRTASADRALASPPAPVSTRVDHASTPSCSPLPAAGSRPVVAPVRVRLVTSSALEVRVLEVGVHAVRDADGRPTAVVATVRDASAPDRGSGRPHSQKMEALGRLAGGVAHDFANQLTAMLNSLYLIRGSLAGVDHPATTAVADYTRELESAVGRAADLTGQLLTFSRREAPDPDVVDLAHVVRSTGTLLQRVVPDRVELELGGRSSPVPVRVDRSHLEHVLVNLVVNAVDAMNGRGRIRVTARRTGELPVGPTVQVAVSGATFAGPGSGRTVGRGPADEATGATGATSDPSGSERSAGRYPPWIGIDQDVAVLSVSDTGVGIEARLVQRIFDPFFTTRPAGHGTGLGLAAVADTVRHAGGLVLVDTVPGRGTRMDLVFPLASGVPVLSSDEHDIRTPGAGHVLVCDEDTAARESTARLLECAGYRVRATGNPDDVDRWLADGDADDVDLLLIDVVMSGRQGSDLVRRVRAARPSLPVLALASYGHDPATDLPDGVWTEPKPCPPARLLQRIRHVLHDS